MISYESAVDRIHLDVMEAEYCGSDLFLDFHPNQHLSDVSLMLDVHLMIQDPEDWVERCTYRDRLASLSIHLDSRQTLDRCLTSLQRLGIEAGIVVRLDDDWELIAHYAERSDLVVVMGTPIGVKGVSLQPEALDTIRRLVALREQTDTKFRVLADGGIRTDTLTQLVHAGADALAIGSLLCNSSQPPNRFWDDFDIAHSEAHG